jgi:hypothetical protein
MDGHGDAETMKDMKHNVAAMVAGKMAEPDAQYYSCTCTSLSPTGGGGGGGDGGSGGGGRRCGGAHTIGNDFGKMSSSTKKALTHKVLTFLQV